MKNEIKIFENPEFGQVRVVLNESNEPLFCLTDVCRVLSIDNSRQVKSRLDEDGVFLLDLQQINRGVINNDGVIINELGNTKANFINESNLYSVIFQSRKEEAKRFQKWVFKEVLPSIHKTGSYSIKPMTHIEIIAMQAQAMVELERKQNELEVVQAKQSKDIEYLKTKAVHRTDYYSIIGFANRVKIKVGLEKAKKLGKMCVKLCKEKGYSTEKIEDPRFGYIRTYPHDVLEEIFAKEYNISFD